MSALDQSLDEIIGNNRPQRQARRNNNGPRKASKQINQNRRAAPANRRNNQVQRRPARLPSNVAARIVKGTQKNIPVRVNVEGLPRDIKQDAVKVCHI